MNLLMEMRQNHLRSDGDKRGPLSIIDGGHRTRHFAQVFYIIELIEMLFSAGRLAGTGRGPKFMATMRAGHF